MGESTSRRRFLGLAVQAGAALALFPRPALPAPSTPEDRLADLIRQAPKALFWKPASDPSLTCASCHEAGSLSPSTKAHHRGMPVQCQLCAHGCRVPEGGRGRCRTRMNVRGTLRSLVYGHPIAEHVDPIEKKPFFHVLPGAEAWSIATAGCPLRCKFCQNWELSQSSPEDFDAPVLTAAAAAARARGLGAPVVAFTYNEPTVFVEYLLDVSAAARAQGLRTVLVSCGFMQEAPLAAMIEVLDAIKFDLKGFSEEFYREVSGAALAPVLRSIRQVARAGRHLEIVNLVVPTLNDSAASLSELAKWVACETGPDTPLHFTRFHPDFQMMNLPPTPVETLTRARESALKEGLRFVYVGNVPGHPGNNTYCPRCGTVVVARTGFLTTGVKIVAGACSACGTKIPGIWS